jgi:MscS family membrane protein
MRDVIARVERLLRGHPRIWPDDMTVAFKQFGPSSMDVEVIAWFDVTWAQYKSEMRTELLLQILEAVEAAGCSLAFPTQKLHLARSPKP